MLENAPFDSFLWPGLILVVVVGGTQTTAALTLLRRTRSALFWSAIAGLGMCPTPPCGTGGRRGGRTDEGLDDRIGPDGETFLRLARTLQLTPAVTRYPLARVANALDDLPARRVGGSLVITM